MKRLICLLLVLAAIFAFFGCSKKEEEQITEEPPTTKGETPNQPAKPAQTQPSPQLEPSPSPSAEPEPSQPQEAEYTGPRNPLTGLPTEEDLTAVRPYAIMLNNLREALPQHGVMQADILYEVLAEGGITRMLGIFQDVGSLEGKIGSIRSSRPYFLDLAQGHDAIYIHAGGSEDAYAQISARGVTNFDFVRANYAFFFRDPDRLGTYALEHTAFTTGELLREYMPTYNVRHDHQDGYSYKMNFADDGTPDNGGKAEKISAVFSTYKTGVFEYDADSKDYKVSEYGAPYVDGNTGEQAHFTNVIVIFASHRVLDDVGRRAIDLVGSGKGYFACGGKYVPINWQKDSYTSQFVYTLEDGTEVTFGRGTTYVNIMPTNSEVIFE